MKSFSLLSLLLVSFSASAWNTALDCKTDKHRIVIQRKDTSNISGPARYHAWNLGDEKGKALLELDEGIWDKAGKGSCSHAEYRFANKDVQYLMSEVSSSCPSDAPSKDAVGKLEVFREGKVLITYWCRK